MEDYYYHHHSKVQLAKRVWIHGFVVGLGVVSAIFLLWVLIRGIHAPPTSTVKNSPFQTQSRQTPQASRIPSAKEISPSLTPTGVALKTQLKKVLSGIKEANQSKNLNQLLAFYSRRFPELPQRAQKIARSWENINFSKLKFRIAQVKPLPDDRVFTRVIWDFQMEDPLTKNLREVTRTYLVWFVNESGEWRIQAIKKEG
ncbi:MAG: hypothetical protein P8168_14195 [Deltaproteobacteria bacterium]|jgi:hypothetical protein